MVRKSKRPSRVIDDPVIQLLEEIRQRGDALTNAFIDLREDELKQILPDLEALRDTQKNTINALQEIKKTEIDLTGKKDLK